MAHGVLNTEHLQDIAVSIAPIDVSGGSWSVGTPIPLVLDEFERTEPEEGVRVDGGQQGFANRRGIKTDYSINFVTKAQQDDFEGGMLGDIFVNYKYFRITIHEGGAPYSYDVLKENVTRTHTENQASIFRFSGSQAYA